VEPCESTLRQAKVYLPEGAFVAFTPEVCRQEHM
jgi:hypothetical protein